MVKPIAVIVALLIALVAVRVVLVGRQGDDQAQVRQALKDAIAASKEGRPGGVMDKISEKLQVNGEEAPAGMRQIAQFVRDQKPDLTISSDTPIVTGDEARIESPIQLTLNFLGQQKKLQFKQVSLLFRRESARDWLVIPVKRWKLSEVRIPEGTIPDLSQ